MLNKMFISASGRAAAAGKVVLTLLPLILFLASLVVLHAELKATHWHDIAASLRSSGVATVAFALALCAVSCLAMGLQDVLALKALGKTVPLTHTLRIALIANGIGQSAGASLLTAGALRWRFYAGLGVSAAESGYVTLFAELGTTLGLAGILAAALLVEPTALTHLGLDADVALTGAAVIAAILIGYPLVAALRTSPLFVRGIAIKIPAMPLVLGQLALGVVDVLCAGGALLVLLHPDPAHLLATLLAFAAASAAAALSGIPAGLGSFEATLLVLSPVSEHQLIAALLIYRFAYYLVPLLASSLVILSLQRKSALSLGGRTMRTLRMIARNLAPQAVGLLLLTTGLIFLLSGASNAPDARMNALKEWMPLAVIETSHLIASVSGFLLLIIAHGAFRRQRAAYHLATLVLTLGAAASIAKGLDLEEAAIALVALAALSLGRDAFDRRSALLDEPFSLSWLALIALFVTASVWVGFFSFRHIDYSQDLWWKFEFSAGAPRFLRATLAIAIAGAGVALWSLLRPARRPVRACSAQDMDRALSIVAQSPVAESWLALTGDKSFLFNEQGTAFLMYGSRGRSRIVFGDPVGPDACAAGLLWTFREMCDRNDLRPVHYQVDGAHLARYVDLGYTFLKLGEEARVPLADFDLAGKRRANLRHAHARAKREGATFEIIPCGDVAALIPQLKAVSDAWLHDKSTREKGFTVGAFEPAYLVRTPCALVRQNGAIKAFANVLASAAHEEVSIDLMRHVDDAPYGTMDFLFVELGLWARTEGFRWLNLGLAPLSGLETHKLAPVWAKAGALVFAHGEHFYNFSGLRAYKEKFVPEWRPKFMASQGGLDAIAALSDAAALISGGLTGVFKR